MSESEKANNTSSGDTTFAIAWMVFCSGLSEILTSEGWQFWFPLALFALLSIFTLLGIYRRRLTVHDFAGLIGFVIGYFGTCAILLYIDNLTDNPLPFVFGGLGLFLGPKALSAPLGQIYKQRPVGKKP